MELPPKWMVYSGKSHENGWWLGVPPFMETARCLPGGPSLFHGWSDGFTSGSCIYALGTMLGKHIMPMEFLTNQSEALLNAVISKFDLNWCAKSQPSIAFTKSLVGAETIKANSLGWPSSTAIPLWNFQNSLLILQRLKSAFASLIRFEYVKVKAYRKNHRHSHWVLRCWHGLPVTPTGRALL